MKKERERKIEMEDWRKVESSSLAGCLIYPLASRWSLGQIGRHWPASRQADAPSRVSALLPLSESFSFSFSASISLSAKKQRVLDGCVQIRSSEESHNAGETNTPFPHLGARGLTHRVSIRRFRQFSQRAFFSTSWYRQISIYFSLVDKKSQTLSSEWTRLK